MTVKNTFFFYINNTDFHIVIVEKKERYVNPTKSTAFRNACENYNASIEFIMKIR